MKRLRVGIIGIGNIGSAHLNSIYENKVSGMTVTAVCDIQDERLQFIRQNYPGIFTYRDSDELIKSGNADTVIIATPHRYHTDIAVRAFENGLHVLVEKPVDVTVSKARKLNEAAEKSGRTFGIMFNQRTNPLFQKAREIVQSGQLGKLKRSVWIITNWYRTQSYYDSGDWRATWAGEGGGVLLNQAPHNLDLWQWICGMPYSVTAWCDVARYHNIEVEDEASVFVRYPNGAAGAFITSTGEYPGTNRLEISGDRGKIVVENGLLKWWRLSCSEREVCFAAKESFAQIETEYTEICQKEPETAHVGILENFANAVLHGEELISPGAEGINELTISNAAYLSAWSGNSAVELPPDVTLFDRLLAERISGSGYKAELSDGDTGASYEPRWQVRW